MTGSTHADIAHLVADSLQLDDRVRLKLVAASTAPDEAAGFASRHHSLARTDYVRGHTEEARACRLRGALLPAAENLGYAMHFVADATVPSASLLFGNHDAFERGCAALAEERRQSRDEGIICQKCRMKVAVIGLERGRCTSCGTALVKKQTPAVVV